MTVNAGNRKGPERAMAIADDARVFGPSCPAARLREYA